MASQSCPELNKAGGPCGGWVPEGAVYCRAHDPEFQCAKDGCTTSRPRGEEFCRQHSDPVAMKRRMLEGRVRKLEGQQRRNPPKKFWAEGWGDRSKSPRRCAERFGVDHTSASRWYKEAEYREAKEKLQAFLAEAYPVEEQELPESHFDWGVEHLPLLIDGFLDFRQKFFKTPQRAPYETPEFQQEWARTMLSALVTGGREMILAPQRHGKTMLFVHLSTYLICLDPNIRILWISVAQRIAKKSVNLVRAILASNQELIDEYAGVGETFVPDRKSTYSWTGDEFTVATRVDYDLNGPNMQALGSDATILSLNADVIIVDDIEDKHTVNQFGTRENTKEWWETQLLSRKQEETGVFVIGSRQHADDLYSRLLTNDQWNATVEQAHNPACKIEGYDGHYDCMLFPEVNTYKWLIGQKLSMDASRWEMIYQNVARTAGLVVFPEEELKACRSGQYAAGRLPGKAHGATGVSLVGGLDPAISGKQAGVLLAYQTVPELKIWLVDMDNRQGGGTSAFTSLIRRWYEKYGLVYWVAEENSFGQLSSEFPEIRDYTSRHGIQVKDWRTHRNKNDEYFGVTGLADLFKNRNVVFPYADSASEAITDEVITQFAIWDEGNSRNKNRTGFKDDIVMAFWMAWDPIRRARQVFNAELGVDNSDPLTSAMTDGWDDAPWDDWSLAV